MRVLLTLLSSALCAVSTLVAQQAAPTASQDPGSLSKIAQMEQTYRESLKARHLPLIQSYVAELRQLQARATTVEDKTAYGEEIARIAKMFNEGGVVMPRELGAAPKPKLMVENAAISGAVFSLDPHEAEPAPPAGAKQMSLGSAAWTLSRLPAGSYDVVAEYTCPEVPNGGEIIVSFGSLREKRSLAMHHATKDGTTFRLLRLGRLVVEEEVLGGRVTVSAAPGVEPWFTVRRILIARSEKRPDPEQ
jgi:hypothetical protein